MRDAVIVEAVRTPTGKRNGGLSGVHPADLSAQVLQALAERSGIDPAVVDDVIWGCVSQVGEQTFDIARTAVLSAGWPESVPGPPSTASAAPPSRLCTSPRPASSPASTTSPWPAASRP
jgi:acetyl-CoA acetyltransferase